MSYTKNQSRIMSIVFSATGVGGEELDKCVFDIEKHINEISESKDQQIKDLESLVEILYTSLYSKDWNEEMEARKKSIPLYQSYQQKYCNK